MYNTSRELSIMGLRCILLDDGVNELINRIKLCITVHIGNDWRYDQKKKNFMVSC